MPKLVTISYKCGCSGYGNPEFECPKHKKAFDTLKEVVVLKCYRCKRNIEIIHEFYWKIDKSVEGFRVQHVHCMIGKRGWSLCTEGRFKHVRHKEPIINSREIVSMGFSYFI